MNLIKDPWLPMRLSDGSMQTLPISAICRADVVDFALQRADFQGAAYQFAIGVLQTAFAPEDSKQWAGRFTTAPDQDEFELVLAKIEHAFNGEGDGPLFMQDYDLLQEQKPSSIAGLLIDAPGENGIKNNTDHFIKRGVCEQMSLEMALLALFTLQINAPSGGAGHRVGLRGGGPLTTLISPAEEDATLWQKLWLNVINRESWPYIEPDLSDGSVFPWLAPTRTSEKKGSEVYQEDVHPLHMYWAMPRRIRLDVQVQDGICAVSGQPSEKLVSDYRTQNYGYNYSGNWSHPLTPYKGDPKKPDGDWLSAKGQPGGIQYKIWDALTFSSKEDAQHCAAAISHFEKNAPTYRRVFENMPLNIWVFGYDMDNMKPRCWYSTAMPFFQFDPDQQNDLLLNVKRLQKVSSDALWHLRSKVKAAWFETPGEAKGDMSFIDLEFWQRTESIFFTAVSELIEQAADDDAYLPPEAAKQWLSRLQHIALDLFDEYALSELGSERAMIKRIEARRALCGWLYGGKDIKGFKTDYRIEEKQEVMQ
ncbi:type I-E CRISPR-associated protein Cse1/CasA [Marinomonas fungiae]|uniref:type I-E CRISPR-associated protein Cse1/CasA n=1 Tax=Marinomonas fungiae TaxID=1137284 RepID=UPI003A901B53